MIDVNELRKGVTFEVDGNLFKVVEYHHHKPGRGLATIKVKTVNLRTGSNLDMTFNSSEKVQDVNLDYHKVQYLYSDGQFYYFMDLETYEQPGISAEILEDDIKYLKEGLEVKLTFYGTEPIEVELPITVDQMVENADVSIRGDTATGLTKRVTTETGLEVQVPNFVDVGDTIRVDTRTGTYITRV